MIDTTILREFEDVLRTREIIVPRGGVIADGKLHRADTTARNGKGDASYRLYPDHPAAGWFINWQDGLGVQTWKGNGRAEKPSEATRAEWAARKKARQKQEAREREEAEKEARSLWDASPPADPAHPYLTRKKIPPDGLRQDTDGNLLVPMMDTTSTIRNVQRIFPDGGKRFQPGAAVSGLFFPVGPEPDNTIIIVEGMADAVSVFRSTGWRTYAAMNCGNLLDAGLAVRREYPEAGLVYFADHDEVNERTGKRPGIEKATKAAQAAGGLIAISPKEGEDANDLYVREGAEAVRAVLDTAQPVEAAASGESTPLYSPTDHEIAVIYTAPDLPTASDAGWRAIDRANIPEWLFQKSGIPVRLGKDDDDRAILETLNADKFRYVVARVAEWMTQTQDKKTGEVRETKAKPPKDVISDMLAYPSDRMPLPIVSRITDVPTVAHDGSICDRPGYNTANKTYYAPAVGLVIPEIPGNPTEQHARDAVQTIVEPFTDFSFKGDADLAHLLCLAILPFARDLICGPTPFHLADAPIHGSGKTLSFETALYPGTGGNYGPMAQTTEEELRKKITTEILAGRPVLFLDNISRELDSANISMAITSPYWFDRVLGKQVDVTLPMRLIFVGTGNNVILSGEIARRTVRIQLDPNTDEPWRREGFRIPNLRGWMHEHRGEMVAAILTLIRAWVMDGKPAWTGRPLGSFEEWSRTIGGILDRGRIGGFLENLDAFYEAVDLEGATWKAFVTAWWGAHKTAAVGTADLFPIAEKIDTFDLGKGTTEKSQRTVLGKKLWGKKNRVVAGYKITHGGKAHGLNKWHLIPTSGGVR